VIFHNPDDDDDDDDDDDEDDEDDDDGDAEHRPRAARVLPADTTIRSPLSTSAPAVRLRVHSETCHTWCRTPAWPVEFSGAVNSILSPLHPSGRSVRVPILDSFHLSALTCNLAECRRHRWLTVAL